MEVLTDSGNVDPVVCKTRCRGVIGKQRSRLSACHVQAVHAGWRTDCSRTDWGHFHFARSIRPATSRQAKPPIRSATKSSHATNPAIRPAKSRCATISTYAAKPHPLPNPAIRPATNPTRAAKSEPRTQRAVPLAVP